VKFDQIIKGKRATTLVDLRLVGSPGEDQKTYKVMIRVLSGAETSACVKFAIEYARKGGVANPKAGDPLYELGLRVQTLFLACLDPDHPDPDSESARFFSSCDVILDAPDIGRDGIHFLYEAQEAWQDACSPQPPKISAAEFFGEVALLAESEDPLALERYRPATRASLVRFMAKLLLDLLQSKSTSGSSTSQDSRPLESAASKPSKKKPSAPRKKSGSKR
jgi:hypothetical protein